MSDAKQDWKVKVGILLGVALVVLVLDVWTKHLVHNSFRWGESRVIISSYFNLTYVRNMGAAFGLLHKAPASFREPFFIMVPVAALCIIGLVFYRLPASEKLTAVALSLITGGAIGNLIDRIRFGYVIDFLDFHWRNLYHWPAFNVADSAIVVGVGVMFIQSFRQPNEEPTTSNS